MVVYAYENIRKYDRNINIMHIEKNEKVYRTLTVPKNVDINLKTVVRRLEINKQSLTKMDIEIFI